MLSKELIRSENKKKRRNMLPADVKEKSRLAACAFLKSKLYKSARQIMLYMPLGNETDTSLIYEAALADGKEVAFPVTNEKTGEITPYIADADTIFEKGAFSVPEPKGADIADISKTDIVIVPGIAFDKTGARVGFGKGCYDRLLSKTSAAKVGFCYDFQIYEKIPAENHDIKMDYLISESGIIRMAEEDMNRVEKALENHKRGYNCAQAVLCAFADRTNFSEDELFRISEAFGFGMGTQGVCGAVSAMTFLAGLEKSAGIDSLPVTNKKESYMLSHELIGEFYDKNKSVICSQIKGEKLRSCDGCIEDAVRILEERL